MIKVSWPAGRKPRAERGAADGDSRLMEILPPAPRLDLRHVWLAARKEQRETDGARTSRCDGGENVVLSPVAEKFKRRHGCQTAARRPLELRSAGGLEGSRRSGGGGALTSGKEAWLWVRISFWHCLKIQRCYLKSTFSHVINVFVTSLILNRYFYDY